MLQMTVRNDRLPAPVYRWQTMEAAEAVRVIPDGAVVGVEGLGEEMTAALDDAYQQRAQPRDLTMVYAAARGHLRSGGLHRLARAGLVRRIIGGQWYPVFGMQALVQAEQIEAYSLPAGVIRRLFRDIADGVSGHLSRSGLGTSADPRQLGGRLNKSTTEELVFVVQAAGAEALLYRTFPVDVALISVAMTTPSASLAMTRDALLVARAARASGGTVIAQPLSLDVAERLQPRLVTVPDTVVDLLITTPDRSEPRLRRLTAR